MAKINKIVRGNPLSSFRQVAPQGGGAFRLLADAMNEAYDRVAPVAVKEMQERGSELGRQAARNQMGGANPYSTVTSNSNVAQGIKETAEALGVDPLDVATVISYETAGTFDPTKKGPTTQWGQHRGLIQFGEPQAKQFGVDWENPVSSQLGADGAVAKYLKKAGVKPGMGLLDIYSAINAGSVGKYGASDASNGGAPGTVRDKVEGQMSGHREKAMALLGATPSQPANVSTSNYNPTVIRNSDGQLESKLYSPFSGPILQAHNAAAQVAYQSEVLTRGSVDMMQMSNQFPLDPQGFMGAAQAYVDDLVDKAPDSFKADLRGALEGEMQKRGMGMEVDRQKDVRARANNSSRALVERQSEQLAEAIATGNTDEIEAARLALDGTLQAREALPGVAWTEEQSVNVFLKAQKAAERVTAARQKAEAAGYKDQLDLIIKAAKNGRTAEGEEILSSPAAIASSPELAREAAAFVSLRDNMPTFLQMTPAQQAEAIASIADGTVSEEWEMDVLDAAQKTAKSNRKAWEEDPMKRAGEVLSESEMGPPPALPDMMSLSQETAPEFIAAIKARHEYGNNLVAAGYTDKPAYFTEEEAQGLATMMGKDTPPEMRAAAAAAIVAGFGQDAVRAFDEIDADPITMFAGKMMAVGGKPGLATELIRGQQILDEGLVKIPAKISGKIVSPSIAKALRGIPNELQAQTELMGAAKAIYANRAQGQELTEADAAKLMEASLQTALGQSRNKRGELTGGVQKIMGKDTLLPVGVSGVKADRTIRAALGKQIEQDGFHPIDAFLGMGDSSIILPQEKRDEMWAAASDMGTPMINGKPLPISITLGGEYIKVIPAGDSRYRMEIILDGTTLDAEDENGNVFFFDLNALMEAAP